MTQLVTVCGVGEAFMALLKSWGAPDHLKRFMIDMDVDKGLVEATCVYNVHTENGQLLIVDDAIVEELKRFHFVEAEPVVESDAA